MRTYGALNPIDQISMPPDTVQSLVMTGGSSAQAADWASTLRQLVRITCMSTLGVPLAMQANLVSTHATVPASGSSVTTGTTAGSTGNTFTVVGELIRQVPAWSTGFSIASLVPGYVQVELWKK